MNIFIRADASMHIGSGHIMRCLVLAKALQKNGHYVCFVTRPQQSDMVGFLIQERINVVMLGAPLTPLIPTDTADYAAWLQVSELDDAENTIALIDDIDLMIVDHYGINIEWEQRVKTQLHCPIMVIDDLVRRHNADIVLDQTLSRKVSDYTLMAKQVLTGCQFALLAPRFAELRQQTSCKQLDTSHAVNPKVLVSMGGIDNPNATFQTLQCLELLSSKPFVTVLLSQRSPHFEQVRAFCQLRSTWITHIEFTHTMPELMLEHDLSIGAPGSTSWERACLGLPSIVIPLADNQQQICAILESSGAVLRVELDHIDSELLPAYHHILGHWTKFQQVNLSLCDGLGTQRVVHCIEQLHQSLI